jgi:glycine/D-amino acid oxidase-like deaminating enzyme
LIHDGLGDWSGSLPAACDVVIVGAGITGALVADALTEAGLGVALIDRRLPATGSTAACTALVQYELDTELVALAKKLGDADAVAAYRQSAAAVATLAEIAATFPDHCGFGKRTSLYLASHRHHGRRLRREAIARRAAGLDSTFLADAAVAAEYQFPSHGALRTTVAGVVDPVRMTRALLDRASARGATILPWTTATSADPAGDRVKVHTDRGVVACRHLVLACGYEVPPSLQPAVMQLHSTYAAVTEPTRHGGALARGCIMWESSRPYTYLRQVDDRVVIGGADVSFRGDVVRDRMLADRTRRLERELRRLLPSCDALIAYNWAGTFAETRDGLPIIGPLPEISNIHYALGYGGNGITFSVIAAGIIRDLCLGRANDGARIYRPDR